MTFAISEKMQSFNDVVEIFRSRGFTIKDFVDEYMCVLSRDNEGFNEAVKIKNNKIQIQATKETLIDLCNDLQKYCTKIE